MVESYIQRMTWEKGMSMPATNPKRYRGKHELVDAEELLALSGATF